MTRRFAFLFFALAAGCTSTAGPFVTRIVNPGDGRLIVDSCYVEYDDFSRTITTTGCSRSSVPLGMAPPPQARPLPPPPGATAPR